MAVLPLNGQRRKGDKDGKVNCRLQQQVGRAVDERLAEDIDEEFA